MTEFNHDLEQERRAHPENFAPPDDDIACEHVCISECRRTGCNCECGERHEEERSEDGEH